MAAGDALALLSVAPPPQGTVVVSNDRSALPKPSSRPSEGAQLRTPLNPHVSSLPQSVRCERLPLIKGRWLAGHHLIIISPKRLCRASDPSRTINTFFREWTSYMQEVKPKELINDTREGRDSWGRFLQPACISVHHFMSFHNEGNSSLFRTPSGTVAISQR